MSDPFVLFNADDPSLPACPDLLDPASTGIRLAGGDNWSVSLRRLRGGLAEGVEVVELCSGPLTVSLLPTRGMGIWKATLGGETAGWDSPARRPVHPQYVDLGARNGLGWLDGFNELLCRCGLAFNGPPGIDPGARSPIESQLTLHGRIANLPAHQVLVRFNTSGPGRISVTGVVDECTLFGPQLRLTSTTSVFAGGTTIQIEDRVENLASVETELELLYHINVGPPYLGEGSQLVAPAEIVVPRDACAAAGIETYDVYLGPTPGYAEQAFFFRLRGNALGETRTLLRNAAGDRGFSVGFQTSQLPCFTTWKCTQPLADGYVAGLEPGTNYPNFKSYERDQGRVPVIAPGEAFTAGLTLGLCHTAEEVAACEEEIRRLSGEAEPTIHRNPTPPFAPVT